jgi:iron complex transport system substrate-binding protein
VGGKRGEGAGLSPQLRVCSLLPSASEIIAQLGLEDSLVGVSDECRWPQTLIGKPVVSSARIDPAALSSAEIDERVRESTADGRSLYAVDAELIARLAPDLIVTQDLCAVCAVSSHDLSTACPLDTEIVSLDPRSLQDVAGTVRTLARRLGAEQCGEAIVGDMWEKVSSVEQAVAGLERQRVFLAEWIDPPYCPGHWIPEMIERAGGVPVLGRLNEPSHAVSWEQVFAEAPDVIVIAPCGLDAEGAAERAVGLSLQCRAVAVDADSYYARPGPRLADGVRQLGHILHPETVPDPGLPAIEL